jgi:hypothetical protein
VDADIKKIIDNGDGNAILLTALIAAAVANSLPTPFDAIYFNRQQKLKQQLEAGQITPKQYWYHDVGEYYLWTSLWYVCLIGVVYALNSKYSTNSRVLVVLVSGGLVFGVMQKNINKDTEIADLKKQQLDALTQKSGTGDTSYSNFYGELKRKPIAFRLQK